MAQINDPSLYNDALSGLIRLQGHLEPTLSGGKSHQEGSNHPARKESTAKDKDDDILYPELDDSKVDIEDYIFDFEFYYERYPDARAQCHHNKVLLYRHWKNIGIGRGYACSPVLDLSFYYRQHLSKNPDISFMAAYRHFLEIGIKRMLASSLWYNPEAYRSRYPKLERYNPRQLLMHFISVGRFHDMDAS